MTSDHGEHFGEHGLFEHGNSLYGSLLRLPLLVVPPGGAGEHRRIAVAAGLVDLAATILDFSTGSPAGLPGESLRPVIEGGAGGTPDARPVVSTVMPNDRDPTMLGPARRGPMISLVRENLHYIRNGDGVEEPYDSMRDPWEENNLIHLPALDTVVSRFRSLVTDVSAWPPDSR